VPAGSARTAQQLLGARRPERRGALGTREGSGFTLLFEALVMLLCREMPMAAVADGLGEHDTRLWRVAAHYVEKAHANNQLRSPRPLFLGKTRETTSGA
jgi:hypothetical protein